MRYLLISLVVVWCACRAHEPKGAHGGVPTASVRDVPAFVRLVPLDTFVTAPADSVPVASLYLLGDSQLHYPYGKRSFAQAGWVDKTVEVAVRPAFLDLSSDLLLDEFLRFRATEAPSSRFIFLGDAADLSCEQELARFFAVLHGRGFQTPNDGGEDWDFVTSNHDGFFVGNFTSPKDADGALSYTDMPEDWLRACAEPNTKDDHRLTKGRFVREVRGLLSDLPAEDVAASWEGAASPDSYQSDFLYYTRRLDDGSSPAVVVGIFLDTVDYRRHFDLHDTMGAGTVGALSPGQLRFVKEAILRAAKAHHGKPLYFAFFGHHPLEQLDDDTREALGLMLLPLRRQLIGYFAAHEHQSSIREVQAGPVTLRQFVTGSTTDWPQHGRLVTLRYSPGESGLSVETQLTGLDPAPCARQRRLYDGALSYTGYRQFQADPPGSFGLAWDEFWGNYDQRKQTLASALEIENLQVRQLAGLYLSLPARWLAPADRVVLEQIALAPYAAADSSASLAALVRDPDYLATLSEYDRWFDPKTLPESAARYRAIHSFGDHAYFLRNLDTLRWEPSLRAFFLCHAVAASEVESRERAERQGVYFIH